MQIEIAVFEMHISVFKLILISVFKMQISIIE